MALGYKDAIVEDERFVRVNGRLWDMADAISCDAHAGGKYTFLFGGGGAHTDTIMLHVKVLGCDLQALWKHAKLNK